jgi:hypothetical protein
MTGGGKEGAGPCTVVSMDDATGMTGEGGQEGANRCAAISIDNATDMIGEGGQEDNLSPSQDKPSSMVSTSAVEHDIAREQLLSLVRDNDGAISISAMGFAINISFLDNKFADISDINNIIFNSLSAIGSR